MASELVTSSLNPFRKDGLSAVVLVPVLATICADKGSVLRSLSGVPGTLVEGGTGLCGAFVTFEVVDLEKLELFLWAYGIRTRGGSSDVIGTSGNDYSRCVRLTDASKVRSCQRWSNPDQ